MSFRKTFTTIGLIALNGAIACSATTGNDGAADNSALTGSLSNAKACAIRDAYAAADVTAFSTMAPAQLPAAVQSQLPAQPQAIAAFNVDGVGQVFVIELDPNTSFYGPDGALIVTSASAADGSLSWSAKGSPLQCAAASSSSSSSSSSGSTADAGTVATCLSTAPIDQTQYPYNPPAAPVTAACTAKEVSDISQFYTDHASEPGFNTNTWGQAVSPACAACAFSDISAAKWAPILSDQGQIKAIDRGGCIEDVSHKADCGRAYQQFQDCTVDACLKDCKTQADFTACRKDANVLTTSCKAAMDTLKTACGADNIKTYEAACKGTTYTFEGPINVACVAH